MTETAAHLADHVIPRVPVRRWVLTIPHRWRYRIAYDHALCKCFLRVLCHELQTYYRNKTGHPDGQSGSVTLIQRFNSGAALSPHFHLVALDGVFVDCPARGLRFIEAGEPSKLDMAELASAVHARIHAALRHLGLEEQGHDAEDALASHSPALAACYVGSLTRRGALGAHAGKSVIKLGADRYAPWVQHDKPRHAHYDGFDLHADVAIAADDRQGLEHLLRYTARSAIAGERLRLTEDGRVALELKRRYHDGTTHLLRANHLHRATRRAGARPHKNLTVYGGVLAPNAKLRRRVVAYTSATGSLTSASDAEPPTVLDGSDTMTPAQPAATAKPTRPNYTWAELMRRTFAVDVLACQHCGGRLKLLAAVMNPKAVRAILASLHLPTEVPELRPARAPPELFEFESA
jgi:Putative transposase